MVPLQDLKILPRSWPKEVYCGNFLECLTLVINVLIIFFPTLSNFDEAKQFVSLLYFQGWFVWYPLDWGSFLPHALEATG